MTRRTPDQYDWGNVAFDETILGKHRTSPRREEIQFVVVHHMAMVGKGDGAANDACVRTWQTREASAHYCVDGKHVRQVVWDGDAAWATGDGHGNHAGISIEHANSTAKPSWKVSDTTVATGAKLVAYLHKVYGLGRPVAGKTLRRHRDFSGTECPGPYLGGSHFDDYVAEAQRIYDEITQVDPDPEDPMPDFPAEVLDLDDLKLTMPYGTKNHPVEVKQPALASFRDVKHFFVKKIGKWIGVAFRTPVGGVTTKGSRYCRTETRQMAGTKLAAWDSRKEMWSLVGTCAVTHLPPGKPEVVVAQMHDAKDDVVLLLAQGIKDDDGNLTRRINLYASWSLGKGQGSKRVFLGEAKLGWAFHYRITSGPNGTRVILDEDRSKKSDQPGKASGGRYYKYGSYIQSNTDYDDADEFAEVVHFKASIRKEAA